MRILFAAVTAVGMLLAWASTAPDASSSPDASRADAPGANTPGWSDPRVVLPRTVKTGLTAVDFDAAGNAYLAVSGSGARHPGAGFYDDPSLQIPRILIREAGEARFGPPQRLSRRRGGELDLAVAPNGAAIAIWGIEDGIQYAVRDPGEPFGPPVTHKRDVDYSYEIDVDLANDGSALVSWSDANRRSRALFRDGLGRLRPVPGFSARNAYSVTSDINERGDMSLVWDVVGRRHMILRQASRPAGGTWTRPRHPEGFGDENGYGHYGGTLVLTAQGESILAARTRYVVCPLSGPCGDEGTFPRGAPWGHRSYVADSLGNVHAYWARYIGRRHGGFRVLDSIRRPGGTFSRPRVVTLQRELYLAASPAGADGAVMLGWVAAPAGRPKRYALYTSTFEPGVGWSERRRAGRIYRDCLFCRRYPPSIDAESLALGEGGRGLAAWGVMRWDQSAPTGALVADMPPGPRRAAPGPAPAACDRCETRCEGHRDLSRPGALRRCLI